VGVTRQQIAAGDKLPPGMYVSIEFLATFAGGKTQRELVSLRLDEDRTWRFTGYFLR
jgi:hypothetical protein